MIGQLRMIIMAVAITVIMAVHVLVGASRENTMFVVLVTGLLLLARWSKND